MPIDKKYYWVVGGIIALVLYFIAYLYINYLASSEPSLGLLVISLPLVLPCHLFNLNKLGNPYVCFIFSIIVYFLIGSLIGLLIYKIKKS